MGGWGFLGLVGTRAGKVQGEWRVATVGSKAGVEGRGGGARRGRSWNRLETVGGQRDGRGSAQARWNGRFLHVAGSGASGTTTPGAAKTTTRWWPRSATRMRPSRSTATPHGCLRTPWPTHSPGASQTLPVLCGRARSASQQSVHNWRRPAQVPAMRPRITAWSLPYCGISSSMMCCHTWKGMEPVLLPRPWVLELCRCLSAADSCPLLQHGLFVLTDTLTSERGHSRSLISTD